MAVVQSALLIFVLRMIDVSLMTIRMLMTVRGYKWQAWIIGFFQALVFIIAIRAILTDLDNWLNVIGYAGGFATGNVVGIWLEERLAMGHLHLRVVSSRQGQAIAEHIRSAGYAVTEIPARGKDGTVTMLNVSVQRKDMDSILERVKDIDPDAFVTSEEVRPVWKGYWGR